MPAHANLKPKLDAAGVDALLVKVFPQLNESHRDYETVEVFPGGCTVRLNATERHLRPGGTVSGAALFMLADIGGYVCVLSHAGPDALSVTTSLNINFMRKAGTGPIDGHCRILKLGVRYRHRGWAGAGDGSARCGHIFDSTEIAVNCGKMIPFR